MKKLYNTESDLAWKKACITNSLLENASGFSLLNATVFVTKCDGYYKCVDTYLIHVISNIVLPVDYTA